MIQYGEQLKSENVFKTFKFDDAGDFITIRTTSLKLLDSEQYGKFISVCGISFNSEAASEEEAIASIEPKSFTANKVIQNLFKSGAMKIGGTYKVTMTARKDSKYTNKAGEIKRCAAHQFEVVECFGIPKALEAALESEAINLADDVITDIRPLMEKIEASRNQNEGNASQPAQQTQPTQPKVRI